MYLYTCVRPLNYIANGLLRVSVDISCVHDERFVSHSPGGQKSPVGPTGRLTAHKHKDIFNLYTFVYTCVRVCNTSRAAEARQQTRGAFRAGPKTTPLGLAVSGSSAGLRRANRTAFGFLLAFYDGAIVRFMYAYC